MKNYKEQVKTFSSIFYRVVICFTLFIGLAICTHFSQTPLDSNELMAQMEKLETIKNDYDSLLDMDGITTTIHGDGTKIVFEGENVEVVAYFDEYDAYVRSDIIDKRSIKDFGMLLLFISIMVIASAFAVFVFIRLILIPVYFEQLLDWFKGKKEAKKSKCKNEEKHKNW